jgi:hypothetical protein
MTSLNKSGAVFILCLCREIVEDFQVYGVLNRLRKEEKENEREREI